MFSRYFRLAHRTTGSALGRAHENSRCEWCDYYLYFAEFDQRCNTINIYVTGSIRSQYTEYAIATKSEG